MNRPDAWNPLREFTDARIALGRSGASLPTREVLNFGLAHARARDAIHQPFASQQLVAPLAALGLDALTVHSAAPDRHTYLRRPDLGRQLADESRADLAASGVRPADLLLVIGDGLSSWAVERQAVPLIKSEAPFVGTGMEYRGAVDAGDVDRVRAIWTDTLKVMFTNQETIDAVQKVVDSGDLDALRQLFS